MEASAGRLSILESAILHRVDRRGFSLESILCGHASSVRASLEARGAHETQDQQDQDQKEDEGPAGGSTSTAATAAESGHTQHLLSSPHYVTQSETVMTIMSRTSKKAGVPVSPLQGWLVEVPSEVVAKARPGV